MKFLPYVLRNVFRNKLRVLFTSLSIAVSLFLVAILYTYLEVRDELGKMSQENNRIIVMHAEGLTSPVPIAHVDRIRGLAGVKAATPMSWFGGRYKEEQFTMFSQFGTDAQAIPEVLDEYKIPPDQLKAWQEDRTGCVAGAKLAAQRGWKLGEKIVLKGDIHPVDLELTLRGLYDAPDTADHKMLWFHWTYLDELLKKQGERNSGDAGTVFVKTGSSAELAPLMDRIEQRFANSDSPVRPMTEQAFQSLFTEMMGNVESLIRYTALAVVFALICVSANAVAMSMRERTREVAVLKAIGFGRGKILGMVLAEAVIVAALGGLLGVGAAKLLLSVFDLTWIIPVLTVIWVPWRVVFGGVALAALIGLISGIVPAWQAANLSVVNGLRKIV